jgi:hypothetical protein
MIEIVNSKNKIDMMFVNTTSQEVAISFLMFNSEADSSKISSSKVNTLALKIRDWLTQENSMDSVSLRKECLYMSFSILERNAKIDAENQKVNTVKINRSSLFSHAEKLFQFRMEGV